MIHYGAKEVKFRLHMKDYKMITAKMTFIIFQTIHPNFVMDNFKTYDSNFILESLVNPIRPDPFEFLIGLSVCL